MDNQDVVALAKVLAKALLIACAYGLPALVAIYRRHERSEAIALLNLLLGWTVVGWLVLLVWALRWTPRRSRLWRRLAGGRDSTRRAPPGSGGSPDGLASTGVPRVPPLRQRPQRAAASLAWSKLSFEGWPALPAGFRRKLGLD
jgi:Superinfection immunity protein